MQEFLGDFICSECFPQDTQFVVIDEGWVAGQTHADIQHQHNLEWMVRYEKSTTLSNYGSPELDRRAKSVGLPSAARATPTTVHSQSPGHKREPVNPTAMKYDPTWLANDIARVIIQAERRNVGNMVLLSYRMKDNTTHYHTGAYMFSMNQKFFQECKGVLYEKINCGFWTEDAKFLGDDGQPDVMKAIIHLLIEEGLDAPTKLGCSRLVPSLGNKVTYWPPLCSSRMYENPRPEHKGGKFRRTDEKHWKSKYTCSGLLGGCKSNGKKEPQLYGFASKGPSPWYCSIEMDLDKASVHKNMHLTYLRPEYLVPGNGGDDQPTQRSVDGVATDTYGVTVQSLDTTSIHELSPFGQKKRRRNRRVQLMGRRWTADINKACVIVVEIFFWFLTVLPGVINRNTYHWLRFDCPSWRQDVAAVLNKYLLCNSFSWLHVTFTLL